MRTLRPVPKIAFGFALIALPAAAWTQLEGLREPPKPIPADAPVLAPLLVDDGGKVIVSRAARLTQRKVVRERWLNFMGELPAEKCELKAEVVATEHLDGFSRQLVRYQVEPEVSVEVYLLRPNPSASADTLTAALPAMVVFHQTTAADIRSPAGLDDNPELHMGVQLARRGYVALCPRCFIFPKGGGYAEQVAAMKKRHPTWTGWPA